jgi:hypothetical protein
VKLLKILLAVFSWTAAGDYQLCDTVRIQDGRIRLNVNEKILVCGSPKGSPAWRSIPLTQAEYQLKVFFQRDGYFSPSFETHGDVLKVWKGPRTDVADLKVEEDGSKVLKANRVRKVEGYPLTSDMLDQVGKWANFELRSHGYACPKIDTRAEVWKRELIVHANPGPKGVIRRIEWEGHTGLDPSVLKRYAAIEPGQVYDVRKTQITTNRLFADGLFELAVTQADCVNDQVDLIVKTSVGKPRLLQFGFGASTEEFPFVDVAFRNSRLDNRASSFFMTLHGSPRLQIFNAGSELFVFPVMPRVFWGPRFKAARTVESDYEELSAKLGADLGRYWDRFDSRWLLRGGPTLNYIDTVTGLGPSETHFLSWEAALAAANHEYELFVREQYSGWTGKFEYRGQRDDIGANLNVDRYDGTLKVLWNIGAYSPPLFVLAMRFQGVAVDASPLDLRSRQDLLPLDYRIFWGGDQNLRGFSRQSLNNGGAGYLTGAYGGFELRLIEELPWRFQPFLLYDIARLGQRRWTTDQAVFSSKGFGLRWASPIGTLRGLAARGEIQNEDASTRAYPEEWVYFFSFGQEF